MKSGYINIYHYLPIYQSIYRSIYLCLYLYLYLYLYLSLSLSLSLPLSLSISIYPSIDIYAITIYLEANSTCTHVISSWGTQSSNIRWAGSSPSHCKRYRGARSETSYHSAKWYLGQHSKKNIFRPQSFT
jgi:hypothetical protein